MTAITADVLEVLETATDGPKLLLPGTLDRKVYVAVDKIIGAAGGKWNRKARAHVFPDDAAAVLAALLETGQVDGSKIKDARGKTAGDVALGWFPTPPDVVEILLDLAELTTWHEGAGAVRRRGGHRIGGCPSGRHRRLHRDRPGQGGEDPQLRLCAPGWPVRFPPVPGLGRAVRPDR